MPEGRRVPQTQQQQPPQEGFRFKKPWGTATLVFGVGAAAVLNESPDTVLITASAASAIAVGAITDKLPFTKLGMILGALVPIAAPGLPPAAPIGAGAMLGGVADAGFSGLGSQVRNERKRGKGRGDGGPMVDGGVGDV